MKLKKNETLHFALDGMNIRMTLVTYRQSGIYKSSYLISDRIGLFSKNQILSQLEQIFNLLRAKSQVKNLSKSQRYQVRKTASYNFLTSSSSISVYFPSPRRQHSVLPWLKSNPYAVWGPN